MRILFLFSLLTFCLPTLSLYGASSKASSVERYVSPEITCMLVPGEKVLWEGAPSYGPVMIELFFSLASILVAFIIYIILPKPTADETRSGIIALLVLVPLMLNIFVIGELLAAFRTKYAITDRRIIIKKGVLTTTVQSIDFRRIKRITLHQGILAWFFNAGSIYVDTGESITYEVVQKNEKVKKIKSKDGDEWVTHTREEETGPDIVRERTRRIFYIFDNIKNHYGVYRTLQQALNK